MRPHIVELVLKKCLGHREGETVLLVTDTEMEALARAFQQGARGMGVDATLISMAPRGNHGEEPSRAVAEAMKTCAIAVLLTSKSLTHTMARREACEKNGVRMASMVGADVTRLGSLLDVDYEVMRARGEELAAILDAAKGVRLTARIGTDVTFQVAGRVAVRDSGDLTRPGAFGNLPAGKVCIAIVEGTAEGIVMIDGSIAGLGRVREPVKVLVEKGRAVEIGDDALRAILQPHGPEAFTLAEFGLGTNPHAALVGNTLEDGKAIGVAHLGFGANHTMGGKIRVPVHIDAALSGVRVEVDGKPLPEKFLVGTGEPAKPDLRGVEVTADTYRTLFENSSNPQAVLDLDTQRILEANPRFERLLGYTRDELIFGRVVFSDLVTRESFPSYLQKREAQKRSPQDRYNINLLMKSGEKKAVELTVRMVGLYGRDVLLLSARDLSERKKLERDMWGKIEELGRANSRVFALTEKIRMAPELISQMLSIVDEGELLDRASKFMCAREGMGYAGVKFYVQRDGGIEEARQATRSKRRKAKLPADHRAARVFRGEEPPLFSAREAVLPLRGREMNYGVMEVAFEPKELEVMGENPRALESYHRLLETLSSAIGLRIENLRLYEQVQLQATTDPLTGVFNRRTFDKKLAEETHRSMRYGRELTLLMLDIDHFAEVNNTMGHKEGDSVLAELAQRFRTLTRDVDVICRYGGDEFAILMPETNYENGYGKAEKLREAVRSRDFANVMDPARPVKVTLSIGVTAYRPGVKGEGDLVKTADEALYRAKNSGRDRVCGAH